LARWGGTALQEEGRRARLKAMPGAVLAASLDLRALPRSSNGDVKPHIALEGSLKTMTVVDYATGRARFVQGHVRRLGISLSKTSSHHNRLMAACLAAELANLDVFGSANEDGRNRHASPGHHRRTLVGHR
jgi:hypothetical protein